MFLLQICAPDLFCGSLGAAGLSRVLSQLLADCGSSGVPPKAWEPVRGRGQSHHSWGLCRGASSWDCAFPGVSLRPNCRGTGRRVCRATYLWFTPAWNGSPGCSEPSCTSVPAWCLRGAATSLESSDLCRAGSFALQMSTLENYTLREIQFILYKVGYLCTVNKYITNLSCLKKVLPFWCLFPKLMLIYKKVLFFFVGFVGFFFLLSSMHIIAFGFKILL